MSGLVSISACLAISCSTRAPRMGPSGAAAPRCSRSGLRSGRSQTKDLSLTRQWRCSREMAVVVSGSASAIRSTSSQVAMVASVSSASMAAELHPALKAVSDAVLAVGSQHAVEDVLQRLVHSARELAGARYAALGIPDDEGGFRRFLVSGMSDELIASLGPLPRKHGVLGAMLESSEPVRTEDLHEHPRFGGWWPDGHPDMRSFLGVPIVAPGEGVIGSFYLTHKEGAAAFDDGDQEVIELLAAHAAIAITNARLNERSRELSMMSERNRLALELHDAGSQKLFGLVLSAESAATLLERPDGVEAARNQVVRLGELAGEALEELRALIQELRPPDLERDGLCGAL